MNRTVGGGAARGFWKSVSACAVAWMAMLSATSAWAQGWVVNETLASAQADLIDYEFSQSRGLLAWQDCCGSLWIASVDKATGKFVPADGKGVLVDPDSMTFQDAQKTKNGPEWVSTSMGDLLVYTKYNGRHTDGNSRIGYAFPNSSSSSCSYISSDSYWCAGFLDANLVAKAPYGSKVDGDPAPRISYVDNLQKHYWRELWNPASVQAIPDFPDSNYPVRLTACSSTGVPGTRSTLYPVGVADPSTGVVYQQVFLRDFDTKAVTQLTFDPTDKYEMWMWCAPEYANELVFFTLVNQVEIRVYRNTLQPDSTKKWTPIYSHAVADSKHTIYSPEPFVWNGHSYIFMAQTVEPNKFRSEVWISNIDPAAPIFKRITPSDPLKTRTDPEVFITDAGPLIYYNRLQPTLTDTGRYKPCRDPSCSDGVWFANPGLPGQ